MLEAIRRRAAGLPVEAAVAYVGDVAADLLRLKDGDLVVVNGSRNALANGATSAQVLRDWYERGVGVFAHEGLHAKVFVVGRTAYVGLANLSRRAGLPEAAEAALETTEPSTVAQARAFGRA